MRLPGRGSLRQRSAALRQWYGAAVPTTVSVFVPLSELPAPQACRLPEPGKLGSSNVSTQASSIARCYPASPAAARRGWPRRLRARRILRIADARKAFLCGFQVQIEAFAVLSTRWPYRRL